MDELVQQIGLAVSNISDCLPRAEAWSGPAASALAPWSGPAASALALELEQISAELGGLILDLLSNNAYSAIEQLQLG